MTWGPGGRFAVNIHMDATNLADQSEKSLLNIDYTSVGYDTLQSMIELSFFLQRILKNWGDAQLSSEQKEMVNGLRRAFEDAADKLAGSQTRDE